MFVSSIILHDYSTSNTQAYYYIIDIHFQEGELRLQAPDGEKGKAEEQQRSTLIKILQKKVNKTYDFTSYHIISYHIIHMCELAQAIEQ